MENSQAIRVANRLGVATPAHCTSTGKALLAALRSEKLDEVYPGGDVIRMRRLTSVAALKNQLAARRGCSTSCEEDEVVSGKTRDLRRRVLSKLSVAAAEIEGLSP
jgi:DNA-binding IclR family transcriptional regulator